MTTKKPRQYYTFAGFVLYPDTLTLCRDGEVLARGVVVRFLEFLAQRARRTVGHAEIEEGLGVDRQTCRQWVTKARRALKDNDKTLILSDRAEGYRLTAVAYRGSELCPPDPPGLSPEMPPALAAAKLDPAWAGSDDFLQLTFASGWAGWRCDDVDFVRLEENYSPPAELREITKRHPFEKPVNKLWSLRDYRTEENFDDSAPRLTVWATRGTYEYVRALTDCLKCANDMGDPDCIAFREKFRTSWWPLWESPLYHNVNAQVTLITQDDCVVLCKRPSKGIGFAEGLWSASIEEQMLREHHKTGAPDDTLFACAERGVMGELGVDVDSARTRLLRVGLEWGNHTAAFCFVAWTPQTFEQVARAWKQKAKTPQEAVALDCLAATPEEIDKAISSQRWLPSSNVKPSMDAPANLSGAWHYTSRARLFGAARHLEYLLSL